MRESANTAAHDAVTYVTRQKIEIEGDVEAAARMVAEICPEQAEG